MSTPLEITGQAILRILNDIRVLLAGMQANPTWTYVEPRVMQPERIVEKVVGERL